MSADLAVVLNRAADLIEPPGAWTQGAMARDGHGRSVPFNDASAVSFCMSGAVYRCLPTGVSVWQVREVVARLTGSAYLPLWNDERWRSQAEAVQSLRDAARLAEHKETQDAR